MRMYGPVGILSHEQLTKLRMLAKLVLSNKTSLNMQFLINEFLRSHTHNPFCVGTLLFLNYLGPVVCQALWELTCIDLC